ncbi:MAG: hypothetical protein WB615_06365 [Candidatus Tumulicola sp.]
MLQNISPTPSRRALEFGIYRDGDNNLDAIQEATLSQALRTSQADSRIEFTVEDTTSLHGSGLHTDDYTIAGGSIGHVARGKAREMSDESTLARFVARTLDNAEASGAKRTWLDLVDHGGGDGGGLQTGDGRCMTMPDIAQAVADGVALHARQHPEDAARGVDGVVANQCLMDTLGFADALSRAGVKWLAASPETMLAPGVPSNVAHAIAAHGNDADAMAAAIVDDVMRTKYDAGGLGRFSPAAAFDVLDLDPTKIARAEGAVEHFNDAATAYARTAAGARAALREDVRSVDGMARFPEATTDMPWRADRPAIAMYDAIASDGRLAAPLRRDAKAAGDAVRDLVLAHRESSAFAAFGGADYSDAVGPTIHAPVKRGQIDPWASAGVSETDNAFYRGVHQDQFAGAIA